VIDRGKVIAEGTSDDLKDTVGGDVVEFTIDDEKGRDAAVAGRSSGIDWHRPDHQRIRSHQCSGPEIAVRIDSWRSSGDSTKPACVPQGLGLRRPSLDDVFLALTGHAAEADRACHRRGEGDGMSTAVAVDQPQASSATGSATTLVMLKRNPHESGRGLPALHRVHPGAAGHVSSCCFRYVFGGAIATKAPGRLRELPSFPASIGQTMGFGVLRQPPSRWPASCRRARSTA